MSSQTKYKTVYSHTYKPTTNNEDCTVFIRYFGKEKVDGVLIHTPFVNDNILIRETESQYIIMGHSGKEISLPKEDCSKTPWYI